MIVFSPLQEDCDISIQILIMKRVKKKTRMEAFCVERCYLMNESTKSGKYLWVGRL